MPVQLHILTRPDDALASEVIAQQVKLSLEIEVRVVLLTEETPSPDYAVLLEQIFAADSVAVW